MAMLAEPRRKQKVINLRGGNKAWSEDTNKFGQKMLERMGWKSGKGLGAREDGIVSHVVARYKNDEKGLGYEERADQWTQHEDSFEKLLANLAAQENIEKIAEPSGESLEAKSKRSRARVHYHKFTRGKDLSRYSEKDLANIFGKKSLKEKTIPAEHNNTCETDELKTEEKVEETSSGQLFTAGGSMIDYFSSKLKSLGKKDHAHSTCRSSDDQDYSFRGFNIENDQPEGSNTNENLENPEECKLKKKKKKRKHVEWDSDNKEIIKHEQTEYTNDSKKKKSKLVELEQTGVQENNISQNIRRSSPDQDFAFQGFSTCENDEPQGLPVNEDGVKPEEIKLKKNKKKQKLTAYETDTTELSQHAQAEDFSKIKKKKRCSMDEPLETSNAESNTDSTRKKKKKKKKEND